MTTTIHDQHNDMYDGPAVELFETVKITTRLMDEARVKQAEAVAALISAHVTPLDDFTDGMRAVFTSNPGTGPLVTNGKAGQNSNAGKVSHSASGSSSAFGPVAAASHAGARVISADGPRASVGIDDVVACVALPSGEVCTVASVERVSEELPTPTEGVLAKILDCTRAQVVTQVRKIMTAVVLMPKLWSLVKQGVIGFDRVLYTAGRAGRAGVCIPVFDDMLTSKRVDVSWKTFKRHVNEILAMLTTPETRVENAKRNRSVSYWVNDDGTATLSLTGPVLEMEAFYQRVRGTARAIMANHIEPFTARLSDEQQALFITENNGETTEMRVGDLGKVEVDDDRLMDQLTLDLITGAKPSTTLRVRVTRTGKQAPIKVTYTKPDIPSADDGEVILENGTQTQTGNAAGAQAQGENSTGKDANSAFEAGIPAADANGVSATDGPSADVSGPGDADGSVWADRREAKQAEQVCELELCVSMPEKEEWLKSQAGITLMMPVLHFLMDNPPPNTGQKQNPDRNQNEQHRPGTGQEFHRHRVNEHRPEELVAARQNSGSPVSSEQAFTYQGSSASPGVGVPPGDGGSPGADSAAGSELDYGLPIKVDPGARVPVMMNNRVPLDTRTADEVIARAKWVYRMFTDPQTGVVLESTPTKYYIPAALKRMVEARHPDCSVPWCAVPARVCEKDHIEPFNHQDPENGGLTVMENLHPLCKRHHQEKTQKRLRVDKMDDGSLAWVFPRIGAMLVYPPESRINQLQYERLLEYFDTGDQDISHTINEYLATEHETAHRPKPETARTPDSTTTNDPEPRTAPSSGQVNGHLSAAYPREVTDEYALAGEVFNGDTRPWEPSNEPPPF
ncbi:HNH endonuclease signature motif containing protein [Brevibacterium paucivorans]|uniref:HNH endonuclease n=1 Tax=Brevibacterium paucivorans TaxID=170994 RepID=A0A2N6VLR3_9MICO|nr:HNH endonuclease signature motif containing protein [Brevibacterium paucivorans]PMD05075.1 HNH endonuclease [Brevibacterium paucivorans]